ncbi:hypothetical protein KBD20_01405 [Candidatus Saccharibacteria bacterium]|nr:hypothetical protein [Candidatus Saccharibacteria bacterium]
MTEDIKTLTLEVPKEQITNLDAFTEEFRGTRPHLPKDPIERMKVLGALAGKLKFLDTLGEPTTAADEAIERAIQIESPTNAFDAAIAEVAVAAATVKKVSSFIIQFNPSGDILDITDKTIIPTVDPGESRGGTKNLPYGPSNNRSSIKTNVIDGNKRR